MREYLYKSLLIPVWIRALGWPLYQCTMTSASEYSAELMVQYPLTPPDRFDPLFSPVAQSWRECLIIARSRGSRCIKISFLARRYPLYPGQHSVDGQQSPMIIEKRAGALLIASDPFLFSRRGLLVALAASHAVPTIYQFRESAVIGGLMSMARALRIPIIRSASIPA
jgi:hypothetical protein